jgi:O-antigen/teichoic acid export membrane protein
MNFVSRFLSGSGRSATVKRNVVGSILIKGISIGVSFFIVPLTLDFVDKELYGVWLTLSSIVIWLNFFDIGFTPGLQNKLTEAIALGDMERGRSLVSSTYAILSLIFIPLMLLLFFIIPWVDWCRFLNINKGYRTDVVMAMYPLILCFCLQMVLKTVTTVVSAYQRTAFSTLFTVIANLLSLIIIIILPHITNPSLFALSVAISSTPILVMLIATIWLYNTRYRTIRPSFNYIDFGIARNIFSLGGRFFIIQVQGIILFQCTNILISNISNPIDVSVYNIAYKYLYAAVMFYSIFMGPLWPAFTDAYTKKDFAWMQRTYNKMTHLYLIVISALFVMVIASPIVYRIWIGNKIEIPLIMTICVAIYLSIHSWRQLQDTLVNGIGKIKLSTYISCVGLFCHIPLAFFLGSYFSALGVVLSMIIINIIYCMIYTIQINMLIRDKARGIWNK